MALIGDGQNRSAGGGGIWQQGAGLPAGQGLLYGGGRNPNEGGFGSSQPGGGGNGPGGGWNQGPGGPGGGGRLNPGGNITVEEMDLADPVGLVAWTGTHTGQNALGQ